MTVGQRIKLRRKQLGISVDELAEKLGKNRATIYRYESEAIKKMPLDILEPIAQALDTTPGALMGWQSYEENDVYDVKALFAAMDSVEETFISELLSNFLEATEVGQQMIIDYAKFITGQEKYRKDTYDEAEKFKKQD